MILDRLESRNIGDPIKWCLATLAFLFSQVVDAQVGVEYQVLDPLVVELYGDHSVRLTVKTIGNPSKVTLVLVDGSQQEMEKTGDNLYESSISHERTIAGYSASKANRNYIGYISIENGIRYNVFVGIDDGTIPEVATEDKDSDVRISSRIFNLHVPGGNSVSSDVASRINRFYHYFADEFDFINIVNAINEYKIHSFQNVRNSISGIGLELFDSSFEFGSHGRLQGILQFPNTSQFDMASPMYLRLLGYNWMNYSRHWKLKGAEPHWPISELAGGIMGFQNPASNQAQDFPFYFRKQMAGNFLYRYWTGNYFLEPKYGEQPQFNTIELYLMGLHPFERADYVRYLIPSNQNQEVCSYCVLQAPFETYSMEDIVESYGTREPDFSLARKQFKIATIVVSPHRLLTQEEIGFLDHMAARGEGRDSVPYSFGQRTGQAWPFYKATWGKGSLVAKLSDELDYSINFAVSDAWYDRNNPGQGFFLNVLPESRQLSLAWFTFETWRPRQEETQIGDPYHRWLIALGPYDAGRAELKLFEVTGGVFGSDDPVEETEIGNLTFELNGCSHALVTYDIESLNRQGQISLIRVAKDNASWCEELQPSHVEPQTVQQFGVKVEQIISPTGRVIEDIKSQQSSIENQTSLDIGPEFNGAWYNTEWPGQGVFMTVLPNSEQVSLAWFTFDLQRPNESAYNRLGDPGNRWLTALGPIDGNESEMVLFETTGGEFLSNSPPSTTRVYGSMHLVFEDCSHALISYNIDSLNLSGEFSLDRVSQENVNYCYQVQGASNERLHHHAIAPESTY